MTTSRRDLLKATGIALIGVAAAAPIVSARARRVTKQPAPPASKGKHFAMAIDARLCADCPAKSACIDACHAEHNVPDWQNPEEEVKWIWKEELEHVFPESLTEYSSEELRSRETLVLCNHCDDPPCVKVCPTKATFKRDDGPVMMDQHRCIGCRYCIAACPYGARSFNWADPRGFFAEQPDGIPNKSYPTRTKGVVEKCTLCASRLARGLEPACVEACHEKGSGALVFGDLKDPDSELSRLVASKLVARRKAELGTRPQLFYTL